MFLSTVLNSKIGLFCASALVLSFVVYNVAFAQSEAKPEESHRFQMSTWSHSGSASVNGSTAAKHGAYIMDTVTGEVWSVEGGGKPQKLGSVR